MLLVRMLGSPELLRDGHPLHLPRRKSRALVYYLAAQAGPVRRETLLTLFWPEAERAAAQQTLRTTLHGLRKTLGSALLVDEEALALAPEVDVDARRFEHELRRAADWEVLTGALALYRGDFLEGFSLPDAPAFDDWAAAERERFRRLAVRGLTALSQQHEAAGDYAAALDALDRALAFDPLQEDVQRTALRLHYLAGDRAGAIRRYEHLRRLLDEEMGVPPMAETRAVYDAIITDSFAAGAQPAPVSPRRQPTPPSDLPPSTSDSPFPFTGRTDELRSLDDLATGHKLALIEGEPGIGKSRLAEEYLRSAQALALTGAARELEQTLPYQPILEALRDLLSLPEWPSLRNRLCTDVPTVWLNEIARLVPDLDVQRPSAPVTADESRLWEGLFQFLHALSAFVSPTLEGKPRLTLFLDDMQWADASTLSLLGYLVRRAEAAGAPIFFLATARPFTSRSPLAGLAQALTREGRLARLPLSRLTPAEVLSYAEHLSREFTRPLAHWLQQKSEGNPYVLTELVRELREGHILHANGAVDLSALSAAPTVPPTVYSLIQSRLARLSDPARRVLDAAVAAGREFEFAVVARAAGLSESAALDALDELRSAQVVSPIEDGLGFTFDHSLTMEVAYREVGEPRHRLLHRRVAEAMETLGRDRLTAVPGLLAWHFIEGGAPERAAPYAFRAGQQAARLAAWREAIAFFEQALAGGDDPQRLPTLLALGDAHLQAGHLAPASEAFGAALTLARSLNDTYQIQNARTAMAQVFLLQGRFADTIALAQTLSDEREAAPDRVATAEVLWGTALSLEGADLAGAAEHLKRAKAMLGSAAHPDPARLAQVKFELGNIAAQQGDLAQAVGLYREALAVAEANEGVPNWRALANNNLAYHLNLLGDPTAGDHIQRGLAIAREFGLLSMLPFLLSTQGELRLAAGDLEGAEAAFQEGLALAEQFANQERIAGLTANLGRVAAERSEMASAIHRLSTALARADSIGTRHLAAQIRLWLAPLLPPAEARAVLAEARAIAESGGRRRLLDEVAKLEAQLT